jgi:hypothetical protein
MDAVVKRSLKLLLGILSKQIGTAQRTNKDEIAGKQRHWLTAPAFLVYQKAQVFRCVARSMNGGYAKITDYQFLTVAKFMVSKAVLEFFTAIMAAQPKFGIRRCRKLPRAGYVIGVDVCLKNMRDSEAVAFGVFQVLIDVSLRIDDNRFPFCT